MIAILRLIALKGWRDRSTLAFALLPPATVLAMVAGVSIRRRQIVWPLDGMIRNALDDVTVFFTVIPMGVAVLLAFWPLRREFETRAISSLVIARSAGSLTSALVVYATIVALAGSLLTAGTILLVTMDLPASIAEIVLRSLSSGLAGASIGSLVVALSPQPSAISAGYGVALVVPLLSLSVPLPALLVVAIATFFTLSVYFVRRRCAS